VTKRALHRDHMAAACGKPACVEVPQVVERYVFTYAAAHAFRHGLSGDLVSHLPPYEDHLSRASTLIPSIPILATRSRASRAQSSDEYLRKDR
jgi:hypothetical protein